LKNLVDNFSSRDILTILNINSGSTYIYLIAIVSKKQNLKILGGTRKLLRSRDLRGTPAFTHTHTHDDDYNENSHDNNHENNRITSTCVIFLRSVKKSAYAVVSYRAVLIGSPAVPGRIAHGLRRRRQQQRADGDDANADNNNEKPHLTRGMPRRYNNNNNNNTMSARDGPEEISREYFTGTSA